eukprot:gene32545-42158_t
MSQIILSPSYRFLPTFNDSPGAHTLISEPVQGKADSGAVESKKRYISITALFGADDNNRLLAVLYCSLLALQFGLQPLIASRLTPPGVSKSSVVIVTEVTKIFIAAVTLMGESSEERQQLFRSWNFIDSLKAAAIPATLYAIQNLAVQYGYVLLDSMTFNLLNQTKTLSAAFWLWIILNQPQSPPQLFALFLLLGAALVLTSGGSSTSSLSLSGNDYQLGLLVVAAASLLSGISAALTQKNLVGFRKRHPFFFSAELAIYGIVFLLANLLVRSDVAPGGNLFSNWNLLTLIPVITNAFGGLVVGLVTKYAGSVVKGFSLIAGILITGLAQYLIDGKPLGIKDGVGVMLVSVSIYLHSSFPPKKKTEKRE